MSLTRESPPAPRRRPRRTWADRLFLLVAIPVLLTVFVGATFYHAAMPRPGR